MRFLVWLTAVGAAVAAGTGTELVAPVPQVMGASSSVTDDAAAPDLASVDVQEAGNGGIVNAENALNVVGCLPCCAFAGINLFCKPKTRRGTIRAACVSMALMILFGTVVDICTAWISRSTFVLGGEKVEAQCGLSEAGHDYDEALKRTVKIYQRHGCDGNADEKAMNFETWVLFFLSCLLINV